MAIRQLGDDLRLLNTLRKLPAQKSADIYSGAAYRLFNVTEARLQRLIHTAQPGNRRMLLLGWTVNLSIIAILSNSLVISVRPSGVQADMARCVAEPALAAQANNQLILNHSMPR